ncbi:MAG TPA: glycosyltransferase [Thermomicrobiaceae bacterium]|nr:glycosyltransferase [Thermomicrobiaceae bacterium]
MRVLLVHNRYQQSGGEDVVFAAEAELLRRRGHEVVSYTDDNDRIDGMNRLRLAGQTIWSVTSARALRELIRSTHPAVVHVHNTFPLISPAVYHAARLEAVPVVQTLHNYRLICPGSVLHRDSQPCVDCVGHLPLAGIRHACYRGSRAQTAVVAAMLAVHRARRTWSREVDCFIALSDFARRQFVRGGVSAAKLVVKPNFVEPDPGGRLADGGYYLYAGRLDPTKGLPTLLAAWERGGIAAPLHIAGDGPAAEDVRAAAARLPQVRLLGRLDRDQLLNQMRSARALVFPSLLYENFPVSIVEAFACGVPVIASRLGAAAEIVEDRRTGLLFEPGDAGDLAETVLRAEAEPELVCRLGDAARSVYLARYTGDRNYQQLLDIYARVMGMAHTEIG